MNDKKIINYEQRIVAYVDILGFSNLIKRSTNNNEILNKIYLALSHFQEEREKNEKDNERFGDRICEYSTQSDCIVISYKFYQKSGAFFNVLTDIYFLISEISSLGFLVRGGITIGKLFHDKQNVFGPALVEAVELEEKCAHYPRVIIKNEDFNKGIKEGFLFSPEDEREYILKRLKLDIDGFWYVDFFEQKSDFDYSFDYMEYMANWRSLIIDGLKENLTNNSVYSKYSWLSTYFNRAVENQRIEIEKINF